MQMLLKLSAFISLTERYERNTNQDMLKVKFPDTLQIRTLSWRDLSRDLARILLLH